MLEDAFLPTFDVSDGVAVVADAPPAAAWDALMDVDLVELGRRRPVVGMLGALRVLPEVVTHVLHGERPAGAPEQLRLRDLVRLPAGDGSWVLLGERPGEELALGLVGRFWRPVIEYATVSPGAFRDFAEPGFAKTIYDLEVRALPDGRSLLTGTMRTATTDEHARRWFRRYWALGVGSGAHVLVTALLEAARDEAETRAAARAAATA